MLSVLFLSQSAWAAPITVAVLEATSSETSADLAAQLNDDTWFDFDATVVGVEDIDEASELAAFDVVVMGGSGYGAPDWTATSVAALDTWVRAGGGLIAVSWFHYTTDSSAYEATIDALLPITMAGSGYEFCSEDTSGTISLSITTVSHPITAGLTDFTTTSSDYVEISTAVLDKGADSLVTASGSSCSATATNHAVVAGTAGDGNVAYLGPMYSAAAGYDNADLRSGSPDRLLEQAVQWAALGGDVDGDGYTSDDCDDNDATIYPGALDTWYDGIDSDCDGLSDYDQDLDGFDAEGYGGDDCDDLDITVNPAELDYWYDGIDQDCDGLSDYDQDLDGFDAEGYGGDDCDDLDPGRNPSVDEIWYDGLDQNCDDISDYDQDNDGADSSDHNGDDCDDTDDAIGPTATDTPYDGIDQDCSGGSDNDADADGFDSADHGGDDCDDSDPTVYVGAEETADDGIDQDCDGSDLIGDGGGGGGGSKTCAAVSSGASGALALLAALVGGLRRRRAHPLPTA